MKQKDSLQNPWAGLSSYEDPANSDHHLKFCGRDSNTYDVTRLIDDNFLVTLYGKSGIGKTSLLNAGVFPALRHEQYTPLSLRLGMAEDDAVYEDIITTAIEYAVKERGGSIDVVNVVDEQLDREAVDYLWNWFVRHRFMNANGEITFPVVVLDQFEESFRRRESRRKIEVILRQLHYLIDESHALNDCIVDGEDYFYDFNFRFVLSIREDDLYRLEDSIDNNSLNTLKQCRYRLRSLSAQGARDVILIPGEGLFHPDEEEQIVSTIIGIARNPEDHSISTNLLSLVCNRIFVEFLRKNDAEYISSSLVDSFIKGNPFERFYNEATKGFSNSEKNYIEDNFVDSTGRRNSVPETDFLLHIKNGHTLLEGNTRILQRTSTSSDSNNYRIELIHDSFCAPLSEMKEKRAKRKRLYGIALMTGISLISVATIAFILKQNHRIENFASKMVSVNQQLREDSLLTVAHVKQIEEQKDSLSSTNINLEKQTLIAENAKVTAEKEKANAEKQAQIAKEAQAKAVELATLAKEAQAKTEEKNKELEGKNKELEEKNAKILQFEKRFGQIDQSADLATTKPTTEGTSEKTANGYIVDGIHYQYESASIAQLNRWAKENYQICANKIKSQMGSYEVPLDMVSDAPCLVYLILNSKSINDHKEKQSWFDLWSLMNDEQKNKLYDILYREAYKLASIEYKYQQKQQEIQNKYSEINSIVAGDPEELNNLAYEYARTGSEKWKEAINAIDNAIKLNPKEANYYDSKGEILLMMGDEQNALRMWQKVMELDPDFLQKHNGSTPLYKQLKESGLLK